MNIKPIAIYFPQYHVIPINEQFWGKGFTDWHNVKKTKPLFDGHHQPHMPHSSIGYYDLSDHNVLIKQANLAKNYGIYGFAYYHYWFHGKRLLETPLDNMLNSKEPNFPFFYIWANEPWTIGWDGAIYKNNDYYIQQQYYSDEDNIKHMEFLCNKVFSDDRYIKINNAPVLAIYRSNLLNHTAKTALLWKNIAKSFGFDDLFLIKIMSFGSYEAPKTINFDMSMEFSPDIPLLHKNKHLIKHATIPHTRTIKFDYKDSIKLLLSRDQSYDYPVIRTICPSWDNTARRRDCGTILSDPDIDTFRNGLEHIIQYTGQHHDHGIFCINAWNEWAEGCYLEPDEKNKFLYLETIKNILDKHS